MSGNLLKNYADILVKEDGVYLIINNSYYGNKITRKDVQKLIEDCKVKDVDFKAISSMFKTSASNAQCLISKNKNVAQVKESFNITVSNDKLEAYITFHSPKNGGRLLTFGELLLELYNKKIVYGINESNLQEILANKEYEEEYKVADGQAPVDGIDGYLKYFFNNGKKKIEPKILKTGYVDYKDLALIDMVFESDILIESIDPLPGVDGISVFGQRIAHKPGKLPKKFPLGKNTYVSEDEKSLIASTDGQVIFSGNRLSVVPVLEIRHDVDNTTGNIDFVGSVLVRGNVLPDFKIKANGNIQVFGTVEGAELYSKADIFMVGGVKGREKAVITAYGNITSRYVESCKLVCGGDIISDSIMHSDIECDGSLHVLGKNGFLVGGTIVVKDEISANTIGSNLATFTYLKVGNFPQVVIKYENKSKEYENHLKEFNMLELDIENLKKNMQKSELSDEKKSILLKKLHERITVKGIIDNLQNEIKQLHELLTMHEGFITAKKVIRAGVKILIGNAVIYIRDDLFNCSLTNENDKIVIKQND